MFVRDGGGDFGYGYIGDGGGCLLRSSGEIFHFLKPQKADVNDLNVLSASLGPTIDGEPVFGMINRVVGDLVIVGTDGVFDKV